MFVDTLTLKFKGMKGEVNSGILKASTAQLINDSQTQLFLIYGFENVMGCSKNLTDQKRQVKEGLRLKQMEVILA